MESMQDIYLEGQKVCDLNVRDKVKVLRQPKNYEYGWDNISPKIDYTGAIGTIMSIHSRGIEVLFPEDKRLYHYPYFVLEKVEEPVFKYKFKTFEPVLVRDEPDEEWRPAFFSRYISNSAYPFSLINGITCTQCIPYENNEELVFTTNNPRNDNEE